jgi:hypothetical protein
MHNPTIPCASSFVSSSRWHGDGEVVSRSIDEPGTMCRTTWGGVSARAMQVANVLKRLDVQPVSNRCGVGSSAGPKATTYRPCGPGGGWGALYEYGAAATS